MSNAGSGQPIDFAKPFRLGGCDVDPATCRVHNGDQVVKLQPQVISVLIYLAARPGRVISRNEIESVVWEGKTVGYDALTGTMFKLRKALGDDPKSPRLIETISKKGYRLLVEPEPASQLLGIISRADTAELVKTEPAAKRLDAPADAGSRHELLAGVRWRAIAMLTALLVVLGTSLAWLSRSTRQAATADQPRRSIVVLPFQSLSEATKGDYFADGLTDDLTTSLAMHPELFVIARDSAFVYKGQTVADADLVAKLKVRYVLRGSVRQDGSNVRINARLIDTETGGHEWAEQFEGDSAHLLDLEHVITQRIITALLQRIVPAGHERELVWRTTNPQAYDAFLAGRQHFYAYLNKQENEKARALFEQALHHDPKFAMAHAMLAWTYAFDAMNGWSANRAASLATALKIGQQAVALNKNMPLAHFVTGLAYREQTEYVKALAEAEKAIALDPNYANGQVLVATLLYYAGRPEDSIAPLKKAIRLNPHHPFHYLFHLGQAYYVLHRYEDAIKAFRDGISRNPSAERLRVWLAAALAQAGKIEDAQWEANEVRALNPNFNLAAIAEAFPFKYKVDADHLMDGLRKAGLS